MLQMKIARRLAWQGFQQALPTQTGGPATSVSCSEKSAIFLGTFHAEDYYRHGVNEPLVRL
jgi:hypothetical protein